MKEGLIGVIVPVYKVEKYIAECIESILAQTYTKFRLILIDDGTPDNAGKICDEYAKKDSRITVIHQENAGVTRARARGVEEADDCEFITFVDGDDMLAEEALKMYISCMNRDVDIVLNSKYYTELGNEVNISPEYQQSSSTINIKEYRGRMIATHGGMPWGKLFKRNIITKSAFDIPREIFYGEDAIMNTRIAFNTSRDVSVIIKPLYFYRQKSNGVCNNFTSTPDYEELLRKYILLSIPEEELNNHYKNYLHRRIWLWQNNFNKQIRRPSWANTKFHSTLIREIEQYRYNMKKSDWLLLKYTNPFIRFLIIYVRKTFNLFSIK